MNKNCIKSVFENTRKRNSIQCETVAIYSIEIVKIINYAATDCIYNAEKEN